MPPITVVLDANLKAQTPKIVSPEEFAKLLDYRDRDRLKLIKASLPGEVRHRNYLGYLNTAWANHQGVILTPDIFWYTLLCESASIIAANVEPYRKFFTEAPGKTKILLTTNDPTVLPLSELIEVLRLKVPGGLAKHFLPEFSTTDDAAREARNAAFADAVSPYYDYETLSCGIPAVRIEGIRADWQEIKISWMALSDVFVTARSYCGRVMGVIDQIIAQFTKPDLAFLKDIFVHIRCGSGSDYRPEGWFAELFREQPRDARSFAPHIAKVKYKNVDTGRSFQSFHGVFGSTIADGFMKPLFGRAVFEEIAKP